MAGPFHAALPIAMLDCAKAVRPNATRANQVASRTEVLSQPHSSQTTTQPAMPPVTSNSAMSRSRSTLASHRGDHLALEEGSRKHHNAPECVYDVS